ncbi:MAG: response regulator, partial [Candidatus Hydrogenedentales bacterium]
GAISLRSEVGRGTTFTLWLPALPEEGQSQPFGISHASEKAAENLDLTLEEKPSILLVDDDESLLEFLSYTLSKAGANVTYARNAGEAILQAEQNDYEVLVAEINLPGLDGLDLYSRLSAEKPLRCVFISGRTESSIALPKGTKLLEKPFTPWKFISAIREVASPRAAS